MTKPRRSTFPLRFEYERTRDLLRFVAEERGTSMNQLAEELIERELEVMALGLESSLSRTLEVLNEYRGAGRREAWSKFAEAEALDDPIRARRADHGPDHGADNGADPDEDPYGIARAFEGRR